MSVFHTKIGQNVQIMSINDRNTKKY
jgi:hypothetical protein